MMDLARLVSVRCVGQPPRLFNTACLATVALCLWLSTASAGRAQNDGDGGVITTKDFGDGVLTVNYFNEESASGTGGCLHVEILSPTGPSPRDRNLEIVYYVDFAPGKSKAGTAYRFPVRLPEGAQRIEATLPYVAPGRVSHPGNQVIEAFWDVGVLEDGRTVEASRSYSGTRLQGPVRIPSNQSSGNTTYHVSISGAMGWSMLRLVDDNVAPLSMQPEMFRLIAASGRDDATALSLSIVSKTNFGISTDLHSVSNIRNLSSAPDRWHYYLQFNYVVLDEGVLGRLASERPKVSDALKQYVAAGGSVLLLSQQQRGQALIDLWLNEPAAKQDGSGTAQSPAVALGDWKRITVPMQAWWTRPGPYERAAATQQGNVSGISSVTTLVPTAVYGGQTIAYGAPGQGAVAVPLPAPTSPRPPNDLQILPTANPPSSSPPQPAVGASVSGAPKPAEQLGPLSIGGAARDLLTVGQTYAMARYGTPLVLADELIDAAYDIDLAASQSMVMYGTIPYQNTMAYQNATTFQNMTMAGSSAPPTSIEASDLFTPLKASLEQVVADLQHYDPVGCSMRPFGLGQIGVVQSSLHLQAPETLQEVTGELDKSASMRISSALDTSWPWRNLISSVGKPPVWTFCAFVLLFGLLLGPGLLVFTGWMGRRSLLIFLVPCVSLIATISIAAYEILHEGFDTNIRISSLVSIDEPTGQAFAWSRQTYFSGWPPGEGLEFPSSVYFRPVIEQEDGYYQYEMADPRDKVGSRIEVGEERVRWTGWLGARQQQQLLIGHPAKAAVPVRATRIDRLRVNIKNLTSENLPFAVVRDEADGYYLATSLMPGAEVECQAQTAYDVGVELSRLRATHMPAAPPEMQGGGGWGWSRRYISYAIDSTNDEMLDAGWRNYMTEHLSLPRNGFVTLQANCDAVYVPLQGKVTESKHLVVGRLVW